MRILPLLVLLMLAGTARADLPSGIAPADATEAIRGRLQNEWQSLVAARHLGAWSLVYRGVRHAGDRVVVMGGWTYFLAGAERRCQLQTDQYLTCGSGDFEDIRGRKAPVWTARPAAAPTVAELRAVHRALYGRTLAIELDKQGLGRASIETIVSTPAADRRTSRRYRAAITVTAQSFAVGAPELVEEYEETCYGVNGCHDVHWSCTRVK